MTDKTFKYKSGGSSRIIKDLNGLKDQEVSIVKFHQSRDTNTYGGDWFLLLVM